MLVVLSVVVSLFWVLSEVKMVLRRDIKYAHDFELTNDEKILLSSARNNRHNVKGHLARASNKLKSLEKLGRGVRRNKNGDFDRRSKLGKKLNKQLPRVKALASRYQNELDKIEECISQLNKIPKTKATTWCAAEGSRIANRVVLTFFSLILILAVVFELPAAKNWFLLGILWGVSLFIVKKFEQELIKKKYQFWLGQNGL
jgi:hypothetical protein